MNRERKGFTLIEMMIVLLVISILMAIAIPCFVRARETSRARTCQTILRQLSTAKEQWAMDNRKAGTDTPSAPDLVSSYVKGTPGVLPACPGGGTYVLGDVNTGPTCSVGTNGESDAALQHVMQ